MKKKTYVLMMMVFVLLLAACNDDNKEDEEASRVVPVEVTEAKIDDFIVEKSLYGRTEPKDLTPVIIPMPGELTELEVENGDIVEEDDLIAKVTTQAGVRNIYAPAAGEIIDLAGKEGSMISETDPLALILDLDELNISLTVTKNSRSLFEDVSNITALIENKTYDIDITTISKLPNETGLYPIETVIENKDHNVLPGMIAVISLPEKQVKQTFVLPTEAIVEESEGTFVYKVVDDHVQKIEITVLETQTDVSAIEGDIEEGDQIVINGQLTLSDGTEVVVLKEGTES